MFLVGLNFGTLGQNISKNDALTDFEFLNKAVVQAHGANYHPKVSVNINAVLQEVRSLKNDSISIPDFRYFIGRALSEIGCLHSSVKAFPLDSQMNKPSYFPVPLLLVENELYIGDFKKIDKGKYSGQKVNEINGLPATYFLDRILHYLSGDGRDEEDSFAKEIGMIYASKLVSYYLDYPSQFKIRTNIGVFSIKASEEADYRYRSLVQMKKQEKILEGARAYYLKRDSIPVLRIDKFMKEDVELWPKVMEVLTEENAPYFVIDLRGNGGGNRDAGSELMRFFANGNFSYSILQPTLKPKPYLNKQGKRYYRFSKLKYNIGKFTHKQKTDLGKAFEFEFKPNDAVYKGQIIVMTDGVTASTSTMLTTWLDKHSNAIFVGRKTGGGYNGNNGGVFPRITLPFSKTIIRFPSYRIVLDDDYKKEDGLKPDVEVIYSVDDWLKKRDKDWDAVLNLIRLSK
jgi:hypothetical protein